MIQKEWRRINVTILQLASYLLTSDSIHLFKLSLRHYFDHDLMSITLPVLIRPDSCNLVSRLV